MQSEIAFSYALNKPVHNNPGGEFENPSRVETGSIRGQEFRWGNSRKKGWLQRWRAADGVRANKVAFQERGVLRTNVIFRSIDGGENWSWADVGRKRAHHRPAAFMPIAAVA
jgi:hypothetical protein